MPTVNPSGAENESNGGPTLWLYGEEVVAASGAQITGGVPRGDPAWASFSRHFRNLTGHPTGGGHFFAEARPEETAAHLPAFLAQQRRGSFDSRAARR